MLIVGYVAAPAIGAIQDSYIATYLADNAEATAEAAAAYAGKMAFRWIAALAIPLALVFFNLNKKYGHVAAASVGSNTETTATESNQMQSSH
jgi:hypothetical protein